MAWSDCRRGVAYLRRLARRHLDFHETFHRYDKADGLPLGARPEAFCEDASGNIWMGMGNTLARYTAGRFTLFTTADGLPASPIHALHLDPAGRLWIATDSGR